MIDFFLRIVQRDLRLASRRRTEALLPLAFFAVAASLFPLGVGPEPQMLREIGPGIVWVCALLASLLSAQQLYAADYLDGALEQLMLARESALLLAAAKAVAHWLVSGLPLVLAAPVFGLLFGLEPPAAGVLFLALLLGTPSLSLLGGLGAALTLGLRGAGMLLALLVLPLAIPVLVFGASAAASASQGLPATAQCSLLGALLLLGAALAPIGTAAALRIAME
jgi:heme exporter protein B